MSSRPEFSNELPSHNLDVKDVHTWENFDFPHWQKWMATNFHIPAICILVYLISILCGKMWMKDRRPYNLKGLLLLWNVGLATFSMVAFWKTFPYLWGVVWEESNWRVGFYKSICSSENLTVQFAFWSWIGVLSKIVELGDTVFIILRKQRLIFLHWYHHAMTLLYTWYIFPSQEPCHRWLMTMNFFVHVLMYSYYALKIANFKLPRFSAVTITGLQILQMVVGIYVNWYTWRELESERGCERHKFNLLVAAVMYTSYLALFANFFYKTYFKGSKLKRT